jgi:hypothetical protein
VDESFRAFCPHLSLPRWNWPNRPPERSLDGH